MTPPCRVTSGWRYCCTVLYSQSVPGKRRATLCCRYCTVQSTPEADRSTRAAGTKNGQGEERQSYILPPVFGVVE